MTASLPLETLEFRERRQWRNWLRKNHRSSAGVWVVFHSRHSGMKGIPYEDSVLEALCFGWVDSLIKHLDEDRHARKFTPRRPGSKWSDINRKRWAELKDAGLLMPAGLASAPTNNSYAPRAAIPVLPAYIAEALKPHPEAWSYFQELAPGYRRNFVVWIHSAKQPETREKRIVESIALLGARKKLGLK